MVVLWAVNCCLQHFYFSEYSYEENHVDSIVDTERFSKTFYVIKQEILCCFAVDYFRLIPFMFRNAFPTLRVIDRTFVRIDVCCHQDDG